MSRKATALLFVPKRLCHSIAEFGKIAGRCAILRCAHDEVDTVIGPSRVAALHEALDHHVALFRPTAHDDEEIE